MRKIKLTLKIILSLLIIVIIFFDLENWLKTSLIVIFFILLITDEIYDNILLRKLKNQNTQKD